MRTPLNRTRINFGGQILLLQLAVVLLVVLVSTSVHAWMTYQRLGEEAEERALSVAQSVATYSLVRSEVARLNEAELENMTPVLIAEEPLADFAENIRERTDALFVVITDDVGTRLSHPTFGELGQTVSTEPTAALTGQEVTNQERGTLGLSARAKVPIYAPGSESEVVGQVSLGFAMNQVLTDLRTDIPPVALTAVGSLGLGVLTSWLLGRRLRRLTLGLEPEEIATLAQDQEAVLRGVDEGVIGVSAEGRVTVVNDEARRLLGLTETYTVGAALEDSGLPKSVIDLVAHADQDPHSVEQMIGPRVLIISVRPVLRQLRQGTQDLGAVVILRDRTQMQSLTRQLQAVTSMTSALRAQRHEFANRLHAVYGLLGNRDYSQAEEYLQGLLTTGPLKYSIAEADSLQDPYLKAFVGSKSVEAAERGVHLRVGQETLIRGRVTEAHDVTTVLGNLIDNAIGAAVSGTNSDRWVEVEVLDDGLSSAWPLTDQGRAPGALHLVVADSGDGVIDPEAIFEEGFTTASPAAGQAHGQGLGLSISRQISRDRGGDLWLADPGTSGGPGAVVCARLPGIVTPPNYAAAANVQAGNRSDAGGDDE